MADQSKTIVVDTVLLELISRTDGEILEAISYEYDKIVVPKLLRDHEISKALDNDPQKSSIKFHKWLTQLKKQSKLELFDPPELRGDLTPDRIRELNTRYGGGRGETLNAEGAQRIEANDIAARIYAERYGATEDISVLTADRELNSNRYRFQPHNYNSITSELEHYHA